MTRFRRTCRIAVWLVLPALNCLAQVQWEREGLLLEGLRQRGLFSLAEFQCRQVLADPALTARRRAEWCVELLRTKTQQALNTTARQRASYWRSAHETANQMLAESEGKPFRVLLQVQDALTWMAQGQLMRMEAEVATQPQSAFAEARATLRTAVKLLDELDQQLGRRIARTANKTGGQAGLTDDELFSLRAHVHYQLARAYRNQALCYPPDSNDRIAALGRAIEQLRATRSQLKAGDELVWQLYLDEAICNRLLGNLADARRALTSPLSESAPAAVRRRARAEQIRLLLAAGKPHDALQQLTAIRRADSATSAELDFAELETYIALWQAAAKAGDKENAKSYQDKVTATVRYLETAHGAYWGRRGELLLLKAAGATKAGDSVDILERTADDLCRKKRHQEALAVYDRAAREARASGAAQHAFDLQLKAALIEQQDQHYLSAAGRFEKLVQDSPDNSKTPEAHLAAIWNVAQSARSDRQALARYAKLLEEHIAKWPDDATTATARLWLARLREGQRQWTAALAAYQLVPRNSPHFADAVAGATRCWMAYLSDLRAAGRPTRREAKRAAAFFESLIRAPDGAWPRRWSELQRQAAVTAARIRLRFATSGQDKTLALLKAALEHNREASSVWQAQIRMLHAAALAALPGHEQQARQLLRRRLGSVDNELELVELLNALRQTVAPERRREIAQLQLLVFAQLESARNKLDAKQRRDLAVLRAETLLAAGQNDRALETLQQLAAEYRDDAEIQIRFAELLLQRDEPPPLRRAIDQWRRVARRLRPGTDAWYRAKFSIAKAYFKLGDRTAAADRLKFLLATTNVGQSKWARQVEQLLDQCRAGRDN